MKWFRIPKEATPAPATGQYGDWKALLAHEGQHQCVYCAIPEARWGGFRNFHVEHYKPKSKFESLINTFSNLFYACSVCNSFKGNDWPREPELSLSSASYPDPSKVGYDTFLRVTATFHVESLNAAGRYLVARLCLNRPQLVIERREVFLRTRLVDTIGRFEPIMKAFGDNNDERSIAFLRRGMIAVIELVKLRERLADAVPYDPSGLR